MLQITDLFKKYITKDDSFELSLNLEIPNPSFIVITGESGSGKSTFAKILSGLILPNHGTVKLDDRDITSDLKNYIEYLEANEPLIDNFTVYQALYAKCYHLYNENEVEEKIESICSTLQLSNLKNQKIIDLSGGEAQRVAVGCMMLSSKPILVLDEATHSLDTNNSNIIVNMLKEVKDKTIIYITHKPQEIEGIGDIYLHFENGKITDKKVVNQKEDHGIDVSSTQNKTKILSIVKLNFFTGIKGHLQTILSYVLLFFLCSCFLAIGTFVTSINMEATSDSYSKVEYPGSEKMHYRGVCGESTKYNVEVHSSYTHQVYLNEIKELQEKFGAVDAIENKYSPYYQMLVDKDGNGAYALKIAPFTEKDVLVGRLYKNKKEAVVAVGETDYNIDRKYYKSLIGTKYGEYTIVGIVQKPHDGRYAMYHDYYASKDDFLEFNENSPSVNEEFYFFAEENRQTIFEFMEKDEFVNCVIDNTLPDDTIATSKLVEPKRLDVTYIFSFQRYSESLNCIPSEHLLAMNETTYHKFMDEEAIACTRFYFNTFKDCETFIDYLNSEGISYSFYYHEYNSNIKKICYSTAFLLIIVFYFIIGILNRRINKNRDLFYNKCSYNKKKLWLAKVLSSTILACISILIFVAIYAGFSQVKYTADIAYYALRWMTVENGFIFVGLALVLHMVVEMILECIPRKKLR